ncbi:MAG: aromatic ring-hydroxylating dioxygenase subunit alpha [Saprospiraceae bacterium]
MSRFEVNPDISLAKTIHTDVYTSPEVFDKLRNIVFEEGWHYVGDTDMLPESGYVCPVTVLEGFYSEPLILIRDQHDKITCKSNVCTHRGNLLVTKPGKMSQMRCGYHGRTFDLNGKMVFMPEFEGVQNFPCQDDELHPIQVFQWGKLLFISFDEDADPDRYFNDMIERIRFFPLDKLVKRDDLSKTYDIEANWALYCENYLEGFHIPYAHKSLSEALDYSNYDTEVFYPFANLQLGIGKVGQPVFDLPDDAIDYGKNVAAFYFWVFPNMMFNFYPWGLSINIVTPISVERTKVTFITYMYDESRYNQGAGSDLDRVEMEDEAIILNVQKGVKSRYYAHGRYSIKREKCTHHFHTLLAHYLK